MKFRREIQNKIDEIKGKLIKLAGLTENVSQARLRKTEPSAKSGLPRSRSNKKGHSQTTV